MVPLILGNPHIALRFLKGSFGKLAGPRAAKLMLGVGLRLHGDIKGMQAYEL